MNIRHCVRIILLNDRDELLLLYADDPSTTDADGAPSPPFWFMVGGGIEPNESLTDAALREIYEETGIAAEHISLGPIVWREQVHLRINNVATSLQQQFLVARTTTRAITLKNATLIERAVIKNMAWFSVDAIIASTSTIFPPCLGIHLPAIVAKRYPDEPFDITSSTT